MARDLTRGCRFYIASTLITVLSCGNLPCLPVAFACCIATTGFPCVLGQQGTLPWYGSHVLNNYLERTEKTNETLSQCGDLYTPGRRYLSPPGLTGTTGTADTHGGTGRYLVCPRDYARTYISRAERDLAFHFCLQTSRWHSFPSRGAAVVIDAFGALVCRGADPPVSLS